jgi:hypothetical protein
MIPKFTKFPMLKPKHWSCSPLHAGQTAILFTVTQGDCEDIDKVLKLQSFEVTIDPKVSPVINDIHVRVSLDFSGMLIIQAKAVNYPWKLCRVMVCIYYNTNVISAAFSNAAT